MNENYYERARPEIVQFIGESVKGKRVLDVGCGAGVLGAELKKAGASHVTGIEIASEPANLAKLVLDEVHQRDIDKYGFPKFTGKPYDIVVFADVLEHLTSPWEALKDIKKHCSDAVQCIISLPNFRHESVVLPLLVDGILPYADAGILDRTHLRFFTLAEMGKLFTDTGWRATGMQTISTHPSPFLAGAMEYVKSVGGDDIRFQSELTVYQYVFSLSVMS